MKTKRQKGKYDCGVACVAMLAGVRYRKARKAIFPGGKKPGKTRTGQLRDALKKLGLKPSEKKRQPFKSKIPPELTTNALIFATRLSGGKKHRHWMVWDLKEQKLRDPYRPKLSYDLESYLTVE